MSIAEPTETSFISSWDGIQLATDIYLPSLHSGNSVDCVLVRTPYGKRGEIDRVAELAKGLNAHGIALVVQDVRSKFDSGGLPSPFTQEEADGVATVEWIASQEWSSARVFPFGDSYAGFTALAVASSRHSAVAGVIARVTTHSIWDYWMHDNGVFKMRQNAEWALFAWESKGLSERELDWEASSMWGSPSSGKEGDLLDSWISASDALPTGHAIEKIEVPMLLWGGWWDVMNKGLLADLSRVTSKNVKTIVGASDHSFYPLVECGRAGNDVASTEKQVLSDLVEVLARFIRSLPDLPDFSWQIANAGWFDGDGMVTHSQHIALYPTGAIASSRSEEGGRLTEASPLANGVAVAAFDPGETILSLQSSVWSPLALPLPDESATHGRHDVLTFTSDEYLSPVIVFGDVVLDLVCRVPQGSGLLVASLCDIHPDGYATLILESVLGLSESKEFDTHTLDLGQTGYRVESGHRLRLALSTNRFPKYLPRALPTRQSWPPRRQPSYEVHCRLSEHTKLTMTVINARLRHRPWYEGATP